ncbi:MAG TPA: RNA polymerase sigma factor [Actinomycetota bacterium]|nr:RNA polymerase sigma factor [Actinomycetota bacterium]
MSRSSGPGASLEKAPARPARVSSGELFASYQVRIRRYISSMVHDPVEADDLTQDVFLQVHRKLDSVRDPDAVVSWLYRIATHLCYDRFRRSSREPRTDPLDVGGSGGGRGLGDIADQLRLDRVLEQREMSACVRSYIDGLSTQYRQVILLHDLEEVSNPQIAQMLGASLDTIKIRLHRARRKLQVALGEHCLLSLDEQGVLVCEPAEVTTAATSGSVRGSP